MQEIPGFKAFDDKLDELSGGMKEGRQRKKHWRLALYLAFLLFLFVVALGALSASLRELGLVKDNIFAPGKSLTYEKKSESENEDGTYTTVFSIHVLNPEGSYSGFRYYYPPSCEKEFSFAGGGGNLKGGTLYAEGIYETTCKTNKPIDDTGELFKLKRSGLIGLLDDIYGVGRHIILSISARLSSLINSRLTEGE